MKTTIIDILKDISEGKTPPKKILFKGSIFEYANLQQDYYSQDAKEWLFDEYVLLDILNDEVEILETTITYKQESNKIEKLDISNGISVVHCAYKINEIIEVLNAR